MSHPLSSFEAGIQQAHEFYNQGRKVDAATALHSVGDLAISPQELRRLAIHFNELNLPMIALGYLQKALQLQDRDPDVLNSLALSYWALAEYEKAESLLLYCSQGIGDIFLLSRYLPLVRPRAQHIILEVDETCLSLFQDCPWVDEVRVRNDHEPPACDLHCELCDLPMIFGTTISTIPPVQSLPFFRSPKVGQLLQWASTV